MPVDEQLDLYGSVVLGAGAAGQGQGGQAREGLQGKQRKTRPASAGARPRAVEGSSGGRPASAGPRAASGVGGGGGEGGVVAVGARKGKGGHEYEHGYGPGGGERPWGGGGGGGGALSAEELARWDGMEFRPEPYQRPSTAPPYRTTAGGEKEEGGELVGQGRAGGGPRLSIQTPVPIFDSPHDPAYLLLTQQWQGVQQAQARGVTFAHAGPEATRKGGAPRGGSGGTGGGGSRARGNINSVVPYKDSPAGLRRAF